MYTESTDTNNSIKKQKQNDLMGFGNGIGTHIIITANSKIFESPLVFFLNVLQRFDRFYIVEKTLKIWDFFVFVPFF